MNNKEILIYKINEKVKAEQIAFKKQLTQLTVEEVIEKAYELTIRGFIALKLETFIDSFNEDELNTLLQFSSILDTIYEEWQEWQTYNFSIQYFFEDSIYNVVHKN